MLYSCQIKSCPQAFVFIRALSVSVGDCVLMGDWGQRGIRKRLAMKPLTVENLSTFRYEQNGMDGV